MQRKEPQMTTFIPKWARGKSAEELRERLEWELQVGPPPGDEGCQYEDCVCETEIDRLFRVHDHLKTCEPTICLYPHADGSKVINLTFYPEDSGSADACYGELVELIGAAVEWNARKRNEEGADAGIPEVS
jgi:hypothetical protein